MVEANRGWLMRLLAGLVVLLGSDDVVRRVVWRAVLAKLVPLESALRRLILVAARDLPVVAMPARERGNKGGGSRRKGKRGAVFALTDLPRNPDPAPRTCPDKRAPRIRFLDEPPPPAGAVPSDDDLVESAALRRRIDAMLDALDDLPGQAKRLARWYGRGKRMRYGGAWRRLLPIRSGRPPGHRERDPRDAGKALATCHDLALRCLAMLDAERAAA